MALIYLFLCDNLGKNSKKNSLNDTLSRIYYVTLPLHLPDAVVMSSEDDGADGWSTTY